MTGSSRAGGRQRRLARRAVLLLAAVAGLLVAGAPAASAHPLGNFSVNSYSGLRVEPGAIGLEVVVDSAEIPTLQTFPQARTGAVPEDVQAGYRTRECAGLSTAVTLELDGRPVALRVTGTELAFPAGAAGLPTTRLTCRMRSQGRLATVGKQVTYRDDTTAGRVGWREITAVGDGVRLAGSDVPTDSVSRVLTAYPQDLLSSPLDQRSASLTVAAGTGIVTGSGILGSDSPGSVAGSVVTRVDRLSGAYTNLITEHRLTLGFGLLAVALAVGLGALHAFAPGHGKTLIAASLVSRERSLRSASLIGLSVALTHTGGVLVLGLVLTVTSLAAPERIYRWLGLLSGVLLVGIGLTLLRGALHRARPGQHGQHDHPHAPVADHALAVTVGHGHDHGHGHGHDDGYAHQHDHDHGHHHDEHAHHHDHDHHDVSNRAHPQPEPARAGVGASPALVHRHGLITHSHAPAPPGARGLLAVGFAGGLVPSPSALVVLLGGIALGRTWFSVLLVLAYGVGMALALVGTGALLVHGRDRLGAWSATRPHATRASTGARALAVTLPAVTALLVVIVGAAITVRAAVGA